MNLRVAVQAGTAQQKTVLEIVVDIITAVGHAGMPLGSMTLLAKQGRAFYQQGRMIAAMRTVAQAAVFAGRSVLPQKRPALLRMAEVAGFVDTGSPQQKIIVTVMRIMATAATHLSEPQRMVACFQGVGPPPGMTGETCLLLRQRIEYPVPRTVNLMTGCTGNPGSLMAAAHPSQPPLGLMAADAYSVLFAGRACRAGAESDWRPDRFAMALRPRMVFAGPVAGFTLQLGKWCIRVRVRTVRSDKYRCDRLVGGLSMAQKAGVGATAAELRRRRIAGPKHQHETC